MTSCSVSVRLRFGGGSGWLTASVSFQRLSHPRAGPFAPSVIRWPQMRRHTRSRSARTASVLRRFLFARTLPIKPSFQPELEWQYQPQIPHHQFSHFPWQIPMDDLDVATDGVSFVVFGHPHHQSIFDEHIPMLSFRRVLVANAQHLRRSWNASSLTDVPGYQLQPSKLRHAVHVIVDSRSVDLAGLPIEPRFLMGWTGLDLFPQPMLSIHRPPTSFVVQKTPTTLLVAGIVVNIVPRNGRRFEPHQQPLSQNFSGLVDDRMHESTKCVHVNRHALVRQRLRFVPLHVAGVGGVIMDLQPVRPQIQHPLRWPCRTAHHESIHHLSDGLDDTFLACGWLDIDRAADDAGCNNLILLPILLTSIILTVALIPFVPELCGGLDLFKRLLLDPFLSHRPALGSA